MATNYGYTDWRNLGSTDPTEEELAATAPTEWDNIVAGITGETPPSLTAEASTTASDILADPMVALREQLAALLLENENLKKVPTVSTPNTPDTTIAFGGSSSPLLQDSVVGWGKKRVSSNNTDQVAGFRYTGPSGFGGKGSNFGW